MITNEIKEQSERFASVTFLQWLPDGRAVYKVEFNTRTFGTVGNWPCDAGNLGHLIHNWIVNGSKPM